MSVSSGSTTSEKHLPGELGVWVFILGDMMVFSLFFAVFLYYRSLELDLFIQSQSYLNIHYGALNTLLLLTSSLLVVMGLQAIRTRQLAKAPGFFIAAIACGIAFSVVKFFEYGEKLAAGYSMLSDNFFMFYYVLTGIHFLHLLLGLIVLFFLTVRVRSLAAQGGSVDNKNLVLFEGGACYWHMVDLLWIVLFPLIYLMK